MYEARLRRNLDHVRNALAEETTVLQSLYTAVVADQIITARIDAAARSRQAPLHRRIFGRGGRRAAPLSTPHRRLRVSGAGR
jgi:hypothetical protein